MKRIKLLSLFLATIFIISCISSEGVSAANVSQAENYSTLFSDALKTDGADSEMIASQLARAFDNDAKNLVCQLSLLTDNDKKEVARLVVYGESYQNLDVFSVEVENLRGEFSDESALAVCDYLLDAAALLKSNCSDKLKDAESIRSEAFDTETILSFINQNLENGCVDEEFFHVLGNAYRADPELFVSMIGGFDQDTINYIAKAVAYDCINHSNRSATYDCSSIQGNKGAILRLFEEEIANDNNNSLLIFEDQDEASLSRFNPMPRSSYIPTIGTMSYTTAPLYVGSSESLSVSFSETSHTSSSRSYYTKVYAVRNGTRWLKATKSIIIPPGVSTLTASYPMSFSEVGVIYTYVEVYSSNGGTLLASRQGTYPDTIKGKWKINVQFSADRSQFGSLALYNASGISQMSISCLGKSAYGYDMYTTNGHTPTGTYTGYLYGPVSPESSYGPYKVIAMTGVSGVIVESGRSGIWIHGGSPASTGSATYPLRPTYGCVRITNANQNTLANKISSLTNSTGYHDSTGNIIITQS